MNSNRVEYLGNKELLKVRQSKATAHARNKYICELADHTFFVGVTATSSLYELQQKYIQKSQGTEP